MELTYFLIYYMSFDNPKGGLEGNKLREETNHIEIINLIIDKVNDDDLIKLLKSYLEENKFWTNKSNARVIDAFITCEYADYSKQSLQYLEKIITEEKSKYERSHIFDDTYIEIIEDNVSIKGLEDEALKERFIKYLAKYYFDYLHNNGMVSLDTKDIGYDRVDLSSGLYFLEPELDFKRLLERIIDDEYNQLTGLKGILSAEIGWVENEQTYNLGELYIDAFTSKIKEGTESVIEGKTSVFEGLGGKILENKKGGTFTPSPEEKKEKVKTPEIDLAPLNKEDMKAYAEMRAKYPKPNLENENYLTELEKGFGKDMLEMINAYFPLRIVDNTFKVRETTGKTYPYYISESDWIEKKSELIEIFRVLIKAILLTESKGNTTIKNGEIVTETGELKMVNRESSADGAFQYIIGNGGLRKRFNALFKANISEEEFDMRQYQYRKEERKSSKTNSFDTALRRGKKAYERMGKKTPRWLINAYDGYLLPSDLTGEQQCILTILDLFENGKKINGHDTGAIFALAMTGNGWAMQQIYFEIHHTKPDSATERLFNKNLNKYYDPKMQVKVTKRQPIQVAKK